MQEATSSGPWVIPEFLGVCRVLAWQADSLSHFLMAFFAQAPRAGNCMPVARTFRQHHAVAWMELRNGQKHEKKPPIRRLAA